MSKFKHSSITVFLYSYFNVQGEQLKQNIVSGRVIKVDSEIGITIELSSLDKKVDNSAQSTHTLFYRLTYHVGLTPLKATFTLAKLV
ncbi:MAG: hypothetical protein HRT51_04675 [Colwellia sp.]|nr:hypothetical protein [Colwellia sp.]